MSPVPEYLVPHRDKKVEIITRLTNIFVNKTKGLRQDLAESLTTVELVCDWEFCRELKHSRHSEPHKQTQKHSVSLAPPSVPPPDTHGSVTDSHCCCCRRLTGQWTHTHRMAVVSPRCRPTPQTLIIVLFILSGETHTADITTDAADITTQTYSEWTLGFRAELSTDKHLFSTYLTNQQTKSRET